MANPKNGELALTVNGKTYTLVLNTAAMASLEEHYSTPNHEASWDECWARVMKGNVRAVRALIWAMLRTHHPDITLEQAGVVIDGAGGFIGMTNLLKGASESATPDPNDLKALGVKENPRTAQARKPRAGGTGGRSTSTRAGSA